MAIPVTEEDPPTTLEVDSIQVVSAHAAQFDHLRIIN